MYRSWLFVPGNQEKHLRKVNDLLADVIIYDLEDAVPEANKQIARETVNKTIEKAVDKVNVVRVNALDTRHFLEDLNELSGINLAGIMLPKTNGRDDILIADFLLGKLEEKQGLENSSLSIIPIIETAKGLEHVGEIAAASERVHCLSFGAEDYMLDLNLEPDGCNQELNYARSKMIVASKAAGIEAPIDSVYTDFQDEQGLERVTRQGKQSGFQGKLLIHPKQINVVNRIFSPTKEQIDEAKQIVALYTESLKRGEGAVQLNGKMIDVPVAERARKILSFAEQPT